MPRLAPTTASAHARGRRSFFLLLMVLCMPTPTQAAWGPWVPAKDARLRWEGRVRLQDDGSAVYDWAGVRLHARFKGGSVAVYAKLGQNYLDAFVDGERVAVLGRRPKVEDHAWADVGVTATTRGEAPSYVLEGLGRGEHSLVLAKRTGPNYGPVTLLGLRLGEDGALLGAEPARARRLEFIGDSLTNGYGNEGTSLKCAELAPYENNSQSWGRLCGEALKAEVQTVAFSGYGLMRNYGATETHSKDPVPFYYPRTVLAEPGLWDRSLFVPDLSVVFLGTNDHSTPPMPEAAEFIGAYHAFLTQVRQGRSPGLPILVAYPDDGSSFAQQVETLVSEEQAQGHKVEGLALPPAGQGQLGCDWHPLVVVHQRWAELAEARISKILNW